MTSDWRTVGHDRAVTALQRGLNEGRLAHAFLIEGPRQIGKMTLAMDLARMLNCAGDDKPCGQCPQCSRISGGSHADVRVIGLDSPREGEARARVSIGIDQMRELQREASLKPFEGASRVFIIDGAERLSEEASNSLLKVLEEPPDQVVIVILGSEPETVLPTIVSRCQRLELRPVPASAIAGLLETRYGQDRETAWETARLSAGRPGWAVQATEGPELLERRTRLLDAVEETVGGDLERRFAYAATLATAFGRSRDAVAEELRVWAEWWRDVLVIKEGVPDLVTNLSRMDALDRAAQALTESQIAGILSALKETMDLLERNVNARLALEQLMLALPTLGGARLPVP